jgi:hypothetical protein
VGAKHFSTSAKTGLGVQEIFTSLATGTYIIIPHPLIYRDIGNLVIEKFRVAIQEDEKGSVEIR